MLFEVTFVDFLSFPPLRALPAARCLGCLGERWLVAVVPNEAPVDLCARLSSAIREHGELLDLAIDWRLLVEVVWGR